MTILKRKLYPVLVLSMFALGGCSDICKTYAISSAYPIVTDCTVGTPNPRVPALVKRAVDGLGFPEAEGPRAGDLVFVGSHYMTWTDQTGYFGKVNGLWSLNGDDANLDFALVEPTLSGDTRPINLLLPGEDGDGQWPSTYNGAEHYEIPRYQAARHTAQAGLREANHFTNRNPALETWRQCINVDFSPARWDQELGSNSFELRSDGAVVVTNRAPLKIVARLDPGSATYACGSDFPFNNEQAGRMELASSYVFYPRERRIDRTYQLFNHSPHLYKAQTGVDKLIGGLLLTDWPRPHYLKQFQRWGSWDMPQLSRDAPFPYLGTGQRQDAIEVHGTRTRWVSATPARVAGRSIGIEQGEGGDVGLCLCHVHGGFELGGSVLAGLTLSGTANSAQPTVGPVHARRILLGEGTAPADIVSHVLQAEEQNLFLHEVGFVDGTTWAARTGPQLANGFLYYRQYLPIEKGATGQAAFVLGIDIVNALDLPVITIDLLHNARDVIASRELKRSAFREDGRLQRFVLDFQSPGDGVIEPRVRWHNRAATRLDGIVVNWIPPEKESRQLEAEASDAQHHTGKQEGAFWGANVQQHGPGLLYFGPRIPIHRSSFVEASFDLFVDVVAGRGVDPQSDIARLDLLVHNQDGTNFIAVERTLKRRDFDAPDRITSFAVSITLTATSWVEPRVYYFRNAYTRLDRVRLKIIHL